MKRIHAILIQCGLIALSMQTYASVTPNDPSSVLSGFYVGLTGIYGEPNETGLGLATDSWAFGSPSNFTTYNKPVNTLQQWDYKFTLGYDLPDTANNIEISYFRVNNSAPAFNTYADSASFASYLFPNFIYPNPGSFVSDAHLKYTIDQADLTVGHYFGEVVGGLKLHPFMGLRYASIAHDLTFAAPGYAKSNFYGLGPLFGIDAHYGDWKGFGIVGHLDSALMVGKIDSSTWLGFGGSSTFDSGKTNRVVINAIAKLGVDFNWLIQQKSSLNVEAGYQVNEYFDSSDIVHGNTQTQALLDVQTDNISYNGPYVTLSYHI